MKRDQVLWFEDFGELTFLEREAYLKGPYRYVGYGLAEDGVFYDIVMNRKTNEYRYTEV